MGSAAFTVEEVASADVRDEVVRFFREHGAWPVESLDQHYRYWDWRYTRLAQGPPRVWVARSSAGELVGHIAVFPRIFRFENSELRVAVPGNFLVHPDFRDTLVGPRLALQPRAVVRQREFDLVLAYGNPAAHQMFMRLGFTELGGFLEYVDVRSWGTVLGHRSRVLARLGGAADAAGNLRRRLLSRGWHSRLKGLSVKVLDPDQVRQREGWPSFEGPGEFTPVRNGDFLAGRYLENPDGNRTLIALLDDATGEAAGYAVLSRGPMSLLWDLGVDLKRLQPTDVIYSAGQMLEETATVVVPLLATSGLGVGLRRRGLIRRSPGAYDAARRWSGYWLPDHPLAAEFRQSERWPLLYGSTHY